jgi:hypothetical protein
MEETVYCLCPSGSGPNSIRLWEAIEFGCVPVLLSSKLELPQDVETNTELVQLSESKRSLIDFISSLKM